MMFRTFPLTYTQVRLLAVLALINFVNFADREVLNPLIPLLRQHFNVSDTQLGSLQTVLLIVLAIASIPFGFLADRFSQPKIIGFAALFWSIASLASGIAPTFFLLLVARGFVGIGEAAYAPAGQAMISDSFSYEHRALAQSVFAAGMLLGGAAGFAMGGILGGRFGWQYTVLIVGALGILPGLTAFRLPEPPKRPRSELTGIWQLLRVPAFIALIVAGTCITFSTVSLVSWGADFVKNYKDFTLREAAISISVISLISLVLGVLSGGYFADLLQKRYQYGRILVITMAFLLAAPFLLLAIQSDEKWVVLMGLFVSGYFMSFYHGPVTAVIHDLTPQRAHATAIGIYMFVTQLIGALGATLVGRISDLSDLQVGLQAAVAVMVFGSLLMMMVIYFVRRDGLHHPSLAAFRTEDELARQKSGPAVRPN